MSNSQQLTERELGTILAKKGARLHFSGILGVSMASLAEMLHKRGYRISGSDTGAGEMREHLTSLGIPISYGNTAELVEDADALIYSFAIPDTSADRGRAEQLLIPSFSRSQLLGELMLSYRHRIGISGSHGKSTTTAAIHKIFTDAGLNPTTLSGASLDSGSAHSDGDSEYFIYEACEYKAAFLDFHPECAVITGVELDHTDCYGDIEELVETFLKSTKEATRVVINSDYPTSAALASAISVPLISYGTIENASYRYRLIDSSCGTRFSLSTPSEQLELYTPLFGEHNVANLTAAATVALQYGIPTDIIVKSVAEFRGIPRRLERICELDGRAVYYDYAHHPTEILAAIRTITDLHGVCTVVFRPHTYTRTRDLWDGFVSALSRASHAVITDVYAAREAPIVGVSAERLAGSIPGGIYLPAGKITEYVRGSTEGAIILMGAGDLEKIKEEIKDIGE